MSLSDNVNQLNGIEDTERMSEEEQEGGRARGGEGKGEGCSGFIYPLS